jgi:hypothetical protein
MTCKMQIPPEKVGDTRSWFKTRGGVLLWHNLEIGCNRPDMMTPATHEDGKPGTPPHWSMGNPEPLTPEQIGVRTEVKIPLPAEWFPKCERCPERPGRQMLAPIAAIRRCSVEELKESLRADVQRFPHMEMDSDSIKCWGCDGTGHVDRHLRVALRKRYWGYELTETGKKKADKTAHKLSEIVKDHVQWDWEGIGYGLANIVFYTEKIEPFTLKESNG